jgi:hypothetical protein
MANKKDVVKDSIYDVFNSTGRQQTTTNSNLMFSTIQNMYRRVLTEMCANRFKWSGLPDSVNTRFLELELFYRGLCIYTHDENYGADLVLRGSSVGMPNMQDDPIEFTVVGTGYNARRLKATECVPIWSNYLRSPDFDIVQVYAYRLAKLDITLDINSDNTRTPVLLAIPENLQLTADNILNAIRSGQGAIKVNSGSPLSLDEMLQPISLGGDDATIEKLSIYRTKLWSECMGILGINNANQEKKERLVEAEVGANDEQIQAIKNVSLNARREAAKRISIKYDLDVSVDYATNTTGELDFDISMMGDENA